jgi:hemolysin III
VDFHDSVSSVSHLATALWGVFATLVVMRLTIAHGPKRWTVAFYGLTLVLLYLASGLYHGVRHDTSESRLLFQKLDKSAIFLFILGSNVPIQAYMLRGALRRWALVVGVTAAVVGVALVWAWPSLPLPYLVAVYAALGVAGVAPGLTFVSKVGWRGMAWFLGFAVIYLVGAVVEVVAWPTLVPGVVGPHELLHLCDTAATFAHFVFLVRYILPHGAPRAAHRRADARPESALTRLRGRSTIS